MPARCPVIVQLVPLPPPDRTAVLLEYHVPPDTPFVTENVAVPPTHMTDEPCICGAGCTGVTGVVGVVGFDGLGLTGVTGVGFGASLTVIVSLFDVIPFAV